MLSPLTFFLTRIGSAPFWLAPERTESLRHIIRENTIQLKVYEGQFWFEADTSYGVIRLNVEALERIWALCFGYLKIWHFQQTNEWPKGEVINLTNYQELDQAREILNWATIDHQAFFETTREKTPREDRETWPNGFPLPASEDLNEDVKAANTLFTAVCAFILLHEVGHIVGGHSHVEEGTGETPKLAPEDMEYAADDFAADFLLRDWPLDSRKNMYVQRVVAIVIGLSLQASLEPYQRIGAGGHPCTPDRFLHFWTKFAVPKIGTAVPIGAVVDAFHLIISLHALNAAKSRPPAPELSAGYDKIEDYLRAIRPLFGCKG